MGAPTIGHKMAKSSPARIALGRLKPFFPALLIRATTTATTTLTKAKGIALGLAVKPIRRLVATPVRTP